ALIAEETAALPFLKAALDDPDRERVTRAWQCIKSIQGKHTTTTVAAAVVRLLALAGEPRKGESLSANGEGDPRDLKPAVAIQALLAYVPFAEDETIEEEIVNALTLLSVREVKVHSALVRALDDPLPARRAAAAVVLGKV